MPRASAALRRPTGACDPATTGSPRRRPGRAPRPPGSTENRIATKRHTNGLMTTVTTSAPIIATTPARSGMTTSQTRRQFARRLALPAVGIVGPLTSRSLANRNPRAERCY